MRPPTEALRLLVLVTVEVALLGAVLRVGRIPGVAVDLADPWRWLRVVSPEDALTGLLHLTAAVVAIWLLASTLGYVVARLTRLPGAIRATARVTVPSVRRTVERALATGLVASTLAGASPAVAQPNPPTTDVSVLREDGGLLPPGLQPPTTGEGATTGPEPATQPATEPERDPESEAPAPGPTGAASGPVQAGRVTVVPGDNLWVIAERHLAGTGPSTREVGRYWRQVVDANRERLRSGDPDLIHPGEAVELPPPTSGSG